ncbi:MAG: hypothetical protein QOF14_4863 [Hyphomicrobiales bacterium]|jgi:hypothetical protein|nr:hypothetical protein [Hyphomicrobiales bacterium]
MGSDKDGYVRDIRNDLRERLLALDGRYSDAMHEYEAEREALELKREGTTGAIEKERAAVRQLLEIEERREGSETVEIVPTRKLMPLADFLIAKVCAHGPIDRESLKTEAMAAGYQIDGRTFHATLMNVEKHGKIARADTGQYLAAPISEGTLFGMGQQKEEPQVVN